MICEPAALRNSIPILEVLKTLFQPNKQYKLFEIASGSGQHVIHFAQNLPNVIFQPSEINPRYLHSIVAHLDHFASQNVRIPLHIDVSIPPDFWALPQDFRPAQIDAMMAINFVHYSCEKAIKGLFQSASGLLKPAGLGKLIIYGPFAFDGTIQPKSNVDFDVWLRNQNPEFGLRDVAELEKKAKHNGMNLEKVLPMPANNYILIFSR